MSARHVTQPLIDRAEAQGTTVRERALLLTKAATLLEEERGEPSEVAWMWERAMLAAAIHGDPKLTFTNVVRARVAFARAPSYSPRAQSLVDLHTVRIAARSARVPITALAPLVADMEERAASSPDAAWRAADARLHLELARAGSARALDPMFLDRYRCTLRGSTTCREGCKLGRATLCDLRAERDRSAVDEAEAILGDPARACSAFARRLRAGVIVALWRVGCISEADPHIEALLEDEDALGLESIAAIVPARSNGVAWSLLVRGVRLAGESFDDVDRLDFFRSGVSFARALATESLPEQLVGEPLLPRSARASPRGLSLWFGRQARRVALALEAAGHALHRPFPHH